MFSRRITTMAAVQEGLRGIQHVGMIFSRRITTMATVQEGLRGIQKAMDARVCGHERVKRGLLLSLVANEHCYIEGPPGSAKTLLAEIIATAADQNLFLMQMHRDSRVNDLLGDEILLKETDQETGGEIIRIENKRGGILTCDVAVLDDITRAPGEALNVLFRILNERQSGQARIPLRTCIACGNPADNEQYYNEALDPAALDRFTVQLEHQGLLQSSDWGTARDVIDLYCDGVVFEDSHMPTKVAVDGSFLDICTELGREVRVPNIVKASLSTFLKYLVTEHDLDETNSILSDRTFLVNALKILKANALLSGRMECVKEDLRVMVMLTTYRVPEEVHAIVPDLIERVIMEAEDGDCGDSGPVSTDGLDPPTSIGDDGQQNSSTKATDFPAENTELNQGEEHWKKSGDAKNENDGHLFGNSVGAEAILSTSNGDDDAGTRAAFSEQVIVGAQPAQNSFDLRLNDLDEMKREDESLGHRRRDHVKRQNTIPSDMDCANVKGIELMMKRFNGSIQSCRRAQMSEAVGGLPRKRRRAKCLLELGDCLPSDQVRWVNSLSPTLPMTFSRIARNKTGHLAMVRDISGSMVGLPAAWASVVARATLQLCKRNRMSLGYAHFNDKAQLFYDHMDFFTKKYDVMERWASEVVSEGTTNYEDPLQRVLHEFSLLPQTKIQNPQLKQNRHIVLLTDGVPTEGDLLVEREREKARELGVTVHAVFIGSESTRYPQALEFISAETSGSQFRAIPRGNHVEVVSHTAGSKSAAEKISEGRVRSANRIGVLAGYGSTSPGYVTLGAVKSTRD